jgi:hypothetical protein
MSEKPQDLKARTKAFALRIIRMYSELPKNDSRRLSIQPSAFLP